MDAALSGSALQVGLIIREREPLNLEYPFDQLGTFLTPNDFFYIRSHFKAPVLDAGTYRLGIGGSVEKPFTIGLDELQQMRSVTRPATLECAGNGRVFLAPQVDRRAVAAGSGEHCGMDWRAACSAAGACATIERRLRGGV